MKNLKLKILLVTIIIGLLTIGMPIYSYGSNNEIAVVKESTDKYMIYIKDFQNQQFEFAFSNYNNTDVNTLTFIPSAFDGVETDSNNIAYVDDSTIAIFENTTYMWVRVNGEVKISAREVDIQDNITKPELESIGKVSKNIPIKLEQEQTVNEVNAEGTKITETVGIVKLVNSLANGEYQLIARKDTNENDTLFALAELLEKNEFVDSYTKIQASKEFIELAEKSNNELKTENWKSIENDIIYQPENTQTGDQYILWVKGDNSQDVHFLTSYREYEEEYIIEQVKTVLPYTYDNNTILIILGAVIVAIVLVSIRIIILKKKELKK